MPASMDAYKPNKRVDCAARRGPAHSQLLYRFSLTVTFLFTPSYTIPILISQCKCVLVKRPIIEIYSKLQIFIAHRKMKNTSGEYVGRDRPL